MAGEGTRRVPVLSQSHLVNVRVYQRSLKSIFPGVPQHGFYGKWRGAKCWKVHSE